METEFDKDKAVRIAEDAADIIDAGWTQRDFSDDKENYCAVGAIRKATHGYVLPWVEDVNQVTVERLAEQILFKRGFLGITDFNDDLTTTQEDVSDLLRHVAKEIANGE